MSFDEATNLIEEGAASMHLAERPPRQSLPGAKRSTSS